MTVADAATQHKVSERGLRQAAQRGAVVSERVGATWLLQEASLAAYLKRTDGKRGRPAGSKDSQPRLPRRRPTQEETL